MCVRAQKQTPEQRAAQIQQMAEAQARIAAAQAAAAASAALSKKAGDDAGHALTKAELQLMLKEFAPNETFDPEVEDMLMVVADDFLDSVLEHSIQLAKHRGGDTLETQDVLLHLERHWDIHIPGFEGEEVRAYPEKKDAGPHATRLAAVRRTVAAATAASNAQRKQARLAAERAKKGEVEGEGDEDEDVEA